MPIAPALRQNHHGRTTDRHGRGALRARKLPHRVRTRRSNTRPVQYQRPDARAWPRSQSRNSPARPTPIPAPVLPRWRTDRSAGPPFTPAAGTSSIGASIGELHSGAATPASPSLAQPPWRQKQHSRQQACPRNVPRRRRADPHGAQHRRIPAAISAPGSTLHSWGYITLPSVPPENSASRSTRRIRTFASPCLRPTPRRSLGTGRSMIDEPRGPPAARRSTAL